MLVLDRTVLTFITSMQNYKARLAVLAGARLV